MANLSAVIGSVLRDVIAAQHEANLYSLSLSENYGKDGKVKDFQLPGVVISEMEMELRYGVLSADVSWEQCSINFGEYRRFLATVCAEAAQTAVEAVCDTVLEARVEREEDREFFVHLRMDAALYGKFMNFIFRNMKGAFALNLAETVDAATGRMLKQVVLRRLMGVVRRRFLADSDLDALFADVEGRRLRDRVLAAAETELGALLDQLAEGMDFRKKTVFPQLDVTVTADDLARMPQEAVHVFRLKFVPAACAVSEPEDVDELMDFDMKV